MLSKDISNTTGQIDSELVGTVAYFSPEILLNKNYSKMSDVFAFSLILYEVVTNERPFNDINDRDIIEKLNERPKFNKIKYPNICTDLIERCWSKEPQERPSFDDILSILTSDSSFLNRNVNNEEFQKYKKFVDSSISSFNRNKRIHHLDRIINTQLNFFPKRYELLCLLF
ncbi:hypothetical protein M9Y10_028303 [Tritrichomonas musculus]|uniref:Protein kinase domain-containing protein n=1 Tax=Tritrichomonas musculus TaxID=1915356 RepID=A0ABR2KIW7_9EUKA